MPKPDRTELGIVGLGAMGSGLSRRAIDCGYRVVGSTLEEVPGELRDYGVEPADDPKALAAMLEHPRTILLSVPAGPAVDNIVEQLQPALEPGDIILDAGNSYWGDSIDRADALVGEGVHFLDLGVSGGPSGALEAPCFMIGGPREAVAQVEPMLTKMANGSGYVHAGASGAGHYVKLVHNGIEFAMLQGIGEGLAMLEGHPEELDIEGTLQCWRQGSVIRSWLIDLMAKAYAEDPDLEQPTPYIEDTGEVNWLVGDALERDVPVPVISQSVMALLQSRNSREIAARAVTMMRHEFGGHPYDRSEAIARERRTGRVGPIHRFDPS